MVLHLAPLAGKAAGDADIQVRRTALTFVARAAKVISSAVRDLVPAPSPGTAEFPLPLPGDDPRDIKQYREDLTKRFNETKLALEPLDRALAAAVGRLADADLSCCLAAHQALEGGATVRYVLRRLDAILQPIEEKTDRKKLIEAPVKAVPALVKSLAHKEVRVRLAGLYVLETLTTDAAPAAETLVKALSDENRFIRWGAARALRNMAPAGAAKSVPALAKALADDSPDVRNTCAVALARCGKQAKGAVEALATALQKGDERLRPLAARALAALGPDARSARPTLVAALADDKAEVRAAAATALGKTGALDAQTKAALVMALDDTDAEVQTAAAAALLGGK